MDSEIILKSEVASIFVEDVDASLFEDEDDLSSIQEMPTPGKFSKVSNRKRSHSPIVKKSEIEKLKRYIDMIKESN